MLLDFNSLLRINEIVDKPYEDTLDINNMEALYKNEGCISPLGWKCEHLIYLVEFDNLEKLEKVNLADWISPFIWGWNENLIY